MGHNSHAPEGSTMEAPPDVVHENPANLPGDTFSKKVTKTVAHHARNTVRGARAAVWPFWRPSVGCPVFVVGCSRAGTTLVFRTFCEADELGALNRETHDFWAELHPIAARDWKSHALGPEHVTARDRDYVCRHFFIQTGRRRFVDKNNQNGLCVPYLTTLFPEAHFVFVKRHPGDNINSLIAGWGKPDRFATWADGLPAQVAIDGGRYDRWCFFLPEGWRDFTDAPIEDVCALQYRAMNAAILRARRDIPTERWTEIRYEDVLRDPVDTFRRAFHSARLRFGPRQEKHCATVLSRPYNAFSEIKLHKWRESSRRGRIERVLPLVADTAHALGYDDL